MYPQGLCATIWVCIIKIFVWSSECISSRSLSIRLSVYHQGLCLTIWVCIIKVFVWPSECVSSRFLSYHLSVYHQGLCLIIWVRIIKVSDHQCASSRSLFKYLGVYHLGLCLSIRGCIIKVSVWPPVCIINVSREGRQGSLKNDHLLLISIIYMSSFSQFRPFIFTWTFIGPGDLLVSCLWRQRNSG